MDIYSILSSKPHNVHYLNRYVQFLENCRLKNADFNGYTEKHHICPKAKDMFPEFSSLKLNPWNRIDLTPRQHFISHIMLWKSYFWCKSQKYALNSMKNKNKIKINSRIYFSFRSEFIKLVSERERILVKNGTHTFNSKNNKRRAIERMESGSHHFIGETNPSVVRSKNGTHHFIGETNPVHEMMSTGSHHFLSSEYQSNLQRKRIANGTHNLLGGEMQRKMVQDGTHNLLSGEIQSKYQQKAVKEGIHNFAGLVPCRDINGNLIRVSSILYHEQKGEIETWNYVHVNSKEARKRKLLI